MAIKGKSRKRSKPKPPALPPKPTVSSRKTPLPLRRNVKRTAVIVLTLLAFLGGLRVWQNVSRSDALRDYDVKITSAQRVFIQYFAPQAPNGIDQSVQAFTSGQLPAASFLKLTELWEKDFRAASTALAKVKTPNKVVEDAQFLIVQGVDSYTRVVRLWNLAAKMRTLADAEKDVKKKKALSDQVQVVLLQADDLRKSNAETLYARGAKLLTDLNVEYGLQKKQDTQQQQQQLQQ